MHSKTIVNLIGFFLSVGGWFLWMLLISVAFHSTVSLYNVYHAFIDNFGRQLIWWVAVGLNVTTLVVVELVFQAVRRVYWPTDQDLMQRIEMEARSNTGPGDEEHGIRIQKAVFGAQESHNAEESEGGSQGWHRDGRQQQRSLSPTRSIPESSRNPFTALEEMEPDPFRDA